MDKCSDALKHGIYNTIVKNNNVSISDNLRTWLENATYEDFKKAKGAGLTFGVKIAVDIEGVPKFDLDGEMDEAEFKKFQTYLKQGKVRNFTSVSTTRAFEKTIDPSIVENWLECMKTSCSRNASDSEEPRIDTSPVTGDAPPRDNPFKYGLQSSITQNDNEIILKIRYSPYNRDESYPIVKEFITYGADIKEAGSLNAGDKLDVEQSVHLERTDPTSAHIILNTDKGSLHHSLRQKYPPPLLLQLFTFKSIIEDVNGEQTVKHQVPAGYKIINGGSIAEFSDYSYILLDAPYNPFIISSYPISNSEWATQVRRPNQAYSISIETRLMALYDPLDAWDVNIFSAARRNATESSIQIPECYILTGGGAQFESQDDNIEKPGLLSSFPKDDHTWKVGIDSYEGQSWTLKCYAVVLKPRMEAESKLESVITRSSNTVEGHIMHDIELPLKKDHAFVGGGIEILKDEDHDYHIALTAFFPNSRDIIAGSNSYHLTGWFSRCYYYGENSSVFSNAETGINSYVIEIKHPKYDIQYLRKS